MSSGYCEDCGAFVQFDSQGRYFCETCGHQDLKEC